MPAQALRSRRFQHAAPAPVLALMLICAILFSQWLGLTHSIVHAAWENKQSTSLTHITSVIEGGGKAHHSCAAFDDATLAAAIYSVPLNLPPLPGKHLLALWQAFASWHAPFTCHFSPRAPPRS